jgi:hypothetical protein
MFPLLPEGALLAALFVGLVAALGGAVALRYLHVAAETARAVRVRLTRARRQASVERLRAERAALHHELLAFVVVVAAARHSISSSSPRSHAGTRRDRRAAARCAPD